MFAKTTFTLLWAGRDNPTLSWEGHHNMTWNQFGWGLDWKYIQALIFTWAQRLLHCLYLKSFYDVIHLIYPSGTYMPLQLQWSSNGERSLENSTMALAIGISIIKPDSQMMEPLATEEEVGWVGQLQHGLKDFEILCNCATNFHTRWRCIDRESFWILLYK